MLVTVQACVTDNTIMIHIRLIVFFVCFKQLTSLVRGNMCTVQTILLGNKNKCYNK